MPSDETGGVPGPGRECWYKLQWGASQPVLRALQHPVGETTDVK